MTKDVLKINKIPKLRAGPMALYVLFFTATKEGRSLKRDEIFNVYKKHVARGKTDRPTWESPTSNHVWRKVDWTEWEWDRNFECWFVYTLGALLKKGYLRVVPAVDLRKIK